MIFRSTLPTIDSTKPPPMPMLIREPLFSLLTFPTFSSGLPVITGGFFGIIDFCCAAPTVVSVSTFVLTACSLKAAGNASALNVVTSSFTVAFDSTSSLVVITFSLVGSVDLISVLALARLSMVKIPNISVPVNAIAFND